MGTICKRILIGAVWDDQISSYPLELEKHGYYIGHTYKVWAPGKSYNTPYGGKCTAYEDAGQNFNQFSHQAVKRAAEIGVSAAKQELLDEVAHNFDGFLSSCSKGRTFCYWWGPTDTHRTLEQGSGKTLWGLEPNDLKGRMPAFLPDVPEVRKDFNDYLG